MDKVTSKGITVDEAVQSGLNELKITREDADIEIIFEGKKGVFGFGKKEAVVQISRKVNEDHDDLEKGQIIEDEIRPEKKEAEIKTVPVKKEKAADQAFEDSEIIEKEKIAAISEKTEAMTVDQAIQVTADYLVSIARIYGAEATVKTAEKDGDVLFQMESEKAGLIIGKHGKIINALQVLAQALLQKYVHKHLNVIVNVGDYREKRTAILESLADRTADRVIKTKQPVFLEPLPAFERKQIHSYLSHNKRITTHSEGKEPHRYLVIEVKE